MKIIYCHHAQRKQERTKPKEFWQNEGITSLGKKDAKIFAKMLKQAGIKLTAVYSSPFFRCAETARIVNQFSNAPVFYDERLNEFGSVEGESWIDCQNRVINAIKDIVEKHDNNDIVLCVTSGVNIGAFICLAYGLKPSENTPFLGVSSCSPIIFDYKKSETSKPRLFRQKNAEFCINTKHCKYKTLTKNELYVELKYKYLEKSNISQEKMDKHILRGAADILQISKDILTFLDIDYSKLLVDIKIMNASKQKIVEQFKETAKQIQSAEKKYLYKKIVKICSCVISLAKLSSHTLQDIEEERKSVENKDGTYLDGILIWENN